MLHIKTFLHIKTTKQISVVNFNEVAIKSKIVHWNYSKTKLTVNSAVKSQCAPAQA